MEISYKKNILNKIFCSFNFFVFITFSLMFLLWRYGFPIVWDDTNIYKISLFDPRKSIDLFTQIIEFPFYFFDALSNGFNQSGYRPLAFLWIYYSYFTVSIIPSLSHLVFVSFFIGLLALFYKIISNKFIKSNFFILICLTTFLFSAPVAQSNWISFAGVPAFIPLFSCLGLYFYFKSEEDLDHSLKYYLYLFFITLLTTWYREFMVALPLTILGMEIVNKCIYYNHGLKIRITKMSIFCVLLILISLFPTFIPIIFFKIVNYIRNFLIIDELNTYSRWSEIWDRGLSLPLKPSFLFGHVSSQLSTNTALEIRSNVSVHLLSILSPSMLITCYLSFILHTYINFKEKLSLRNYDLNSIFSILGIIFGFIGLLSIFFQIFRITYYDIFLPYHFCILSIIFISASIDKRLTVWFIVFLSPFYFVFTERVHLTYVLMPLSIIVTSVFFHSWNRFKFYYKSNFNFGYFLIITGISIGLLDSISNPISVRDVMSETARGIYEVSKKFVNMKTDNRVSIISNTISMHDMRIYFDDDEDNPNENKNNYKFELLLTIKAGHDGSIRTITDPNELQDFIDGNGDYGPNSIHESEVKYFENHDIFFLNTNFKRRLQKKGYHQHNFVLKPYVKTKDYGKIYHTKVEYFMPDLLRSIFNREYYSFLGAPDLQDDFYYGPSENLFFGKVEAEYLLQKVISKKVDKTIKWDYTSGRPTLVRSIKNYNIVTFDGSTYGVPHGLWIDWFEENNLRHLPGMIVGDTVEELEQKIMEKN